MKVIFIWVKSVIATSSTRIERNFIKLWNKGDHLFDILCNRNFENFSKSRGLSNKVSKHHNQILILFENKIISYVF